MGSLISMHAMKSYNHSMNSVFALACPKAANLFGGTCYIIQYLVGKGVPFPTLSHGA